MTIGNNLSTLHGANGHVSRVLFPPKRAKGRRRGVKWDERKRRVWRDNDWVKFAFGLGWVT